MLYYICITFMEKNLSTLDLFYIIKISNWRKKYMITRAGLQGELMIKLCELADIEQNELKIAIALYISQYENGERRSWQIFKKASSNRFCFMEK